MQQMATSSSPTHDLNMFFLVEHEEQYYYLLDRKNH